MARGYKVIVRLLTDELGGGFAAYAPELVGCVAVGSTSEEAVEELADAVDCWLKHARVCGRRIPEQGRMQQEPPAEA